MSLNISMRVRFFQSILHLIPVLKRTELPALMFTFNYINLKSTATVQTDMNTNLRTHNFSYETYITTHEDKDVY